MGLSVADLSAKLGLDTSVFDRGISGVLGKMNPIGGAATKTGLIAGGAIAAIGVAAYKMGAEFDDAYDSIRLGTGATGAKLDGLKNDFKKVVTDVPANFGDAATAIKGLNQRLGETGPQLRDSADQFLELSRITGTDVADNVRLGTRLFGDWSIKTKDQASTMDQLYRATQKSGVGLSDLMSTVVQFGAPLRNMGFGFTDSVAMLSKWEKEGVNVTTVLAGMRFALGNFASEGIAPAKGFAKAIDDISAAKTRAAGIAIGKDIFGRKAVSDIVDAIRGGRLEYEKYAETIAKGSDTIHTAAKETEDAAESMTKSWNKLKVSVEPAVSKIFDYLSRNVEDPFGIQKWGDVRGLESMTKTLTDKLPKQWGQAAARTKAIIEDLNRLIEDPAVLGDIHAEHTRGQLKNIRDDIVKQLGISVQEADQVMATMFKGWNPKATIGDKINPAAAGAEARIRRMRAQLARNLAFGKLDNGPLIAKIKAAEAKQAEMRAQLQQSIAVGSLNTSGWIGPISAATQELHAFRTLVGAGMYAPPIVLDIIKPNPPRTALGGVFSAPQIRLIGEAGPEAIIPLSNPRRAAQVMAEAGLSGSRGGGSGSISTGPVHIHLEGLFESGEDAGAAAAEAFTQHTREIARGY